MMSNDFLLILLGVSAGFSIAKPAMATTITFGNPNLSLSTVSEFQPIDASGIPPSFIPDDDTFTLPFSETIAVGFAGNWYRYEFELPDNFTNLSFNLELSVDNKVQVFLNDQIAAIEDDIDVANFNPPFPEFSLVGNTVTNVSGTWDNLPINQNQFQTGINELTFFATNNGGGGAFSILNGQIDFDVIVEPVPEHLSVLGFGVVLGLGAIFKRSKK